MRLKPIDIISAAIEIFIGLLIAFVFILIYFYSDFSNYDISVLWTFRVLYLMVLPGVGLLFIILAFVKLYKANKKYKEEKKEDSENE